MPYTPPHRSPASSAPSSPEGSRRPSFHQASTNTRPTLPRSASYMTKHRRTPPAAGAQRPMAEPSPESTSEDLKGMVAGSSLRQSPPPITGDRAIPNGAIISPPDSSSDDDDLPEVRGRQIENLQELQAAVSDLPRQRSLSPTLQDPKLVNKPDAGDLHVLPAQATAIVQGVHHSFSTTSLEGLSSGPQRKISHTRSATEPNVMLTKTSASSSATSEEESEGEGFRKPQMVRKKSGELVRPALRPPSRRRPSSMPGTPTFSKAVHFDSHLEHVRHFLQVDRPLAVSAGSSPVDNYESDNEYPFASDDRSALRTPPFEWEITVANFAVETPARRALPVRLERVWLSNDQKSLVGSVAVANLAFQKQVACRFTLDYWKTTSEVAAEYSCSIQSGEGALGQDRFNFTIKLSDLANLESKTLFFCIRYNVNGQEYWDNNGGTNFQVDFRKKLVPQNGKKGSIGAASRLAGGLPKSSRRPTAAAVNKGKPGASDEFGDGSKKADFGQSIHEYLGESGRSGLRLKGVRSAVTLATDNLSSRLAPPSGQAFSGRYDFGVSLSNAIQTAKDSMSAKNDVLYMKSSKKPAAHKTSEPEANTTAKQEPVAQGGGAGVIRPLTIPGNDSPSMGFSTASYEEIVNKWCFYGTKPPSPQTKESSVRASHDGANELTLSPNSSSTASYEGSPVQMGNYRHAHSGTQHHSLHHSDPNSYFTHMSALMTMGGSPSQSPLTTYPPQSIQGPVTAQSKPAAPAQSAARTSSPPALEESFASFAGTSSNEYPYPYQHQLLSGRFPFSGAEAHAAAIRG